MNTAIRDFCIKYRQKLNLDKDIEENPPIWFFDDRRDRIEFRLNVYAKSPSGIVLGYDNGRNLFKLDDEDLQYLYDKYSKKIEQEKKENISEIEKMYENGSFNI